MHCLSLKVQLTIGICELLSQPIGVWACGIRVENRARNGLTSIESSHRSQSESLFNLGLLDDCA